MPPLPMAVLQTQTTFDQAFQAGMRAEAQGRWREALAAYRRAVELQPEPGARVLTYGLNLLENYWPYQRMARCHLELGELEAAQGLLVRSERAGEPGDVRAVLRRRLDEAQARRSAPSQAVVPEAPRPTFPPAEKPAPPAPEPAASAPRLPVTGPPAGQLVSEGKPKGVPPIAPVTAAPPPRQSGPMPAVPPGTEREATALLWSGLLAGALLAVLIWRLASRRRAPSARTAPERLGPYRVVSLLGQGGFATTYQGVHARTGETVALKVPHAHVLLDEEHLRRFEREATLGSELSHPNLVRVLGVGREGSQPYLVMAYLEGLPLDRLLRSRGRLLPAEALAYAADLADALAFAHARNVIHRDLKPGNVMITQDGACLMDLGIARSLEEAGVTTTLSFLGTPQYAAPESLLGEPTGPAADLFGLGVLTFEMLAGQPPHPRITPVALMALYARGEGPDLAALPVDLPPEVRAMLLALLAREPRFRPGAAEAAQTFRRWAALGTGSPARGDGQPPPVPRG